MTLIEILVVLVLIGIVLGIVGGNFIGRGEKAKGDAAKIEIGQIGQALDLYKLEVGRYPTTQEGLQALIQAPSGASNWNGPYWKNVDAAEGPVGQRVQVHVARRRTAALRHHCPTAPTARKAAKGRTRTSPVRNERRARRARDDRRAPESRRGARALARASRA